MNNDQFDNLTRTLANGISRRQFLKMLVLGTIATIFPVPGLEKAKAAAPTSVCPVGGIAPELIDPGIASGAKCRGNCGVDCATCDQHADVHICVNQDGQDTHCTYIGVLECDSHQGCRDHDECYDWCAENGELDIRGPCHKKICDKKCRNDWGTKTCLGWAAGIGPVDSHPLYSFPPVPTPCGRCRKCEPGVGCVPKFCGTCLTCNEDNGNCEPKTCPACMECNPQTGDCEAKTCLECTECNPQTGNCEPVVDCPCRGITCDECMHCENGLCVRTCTDNEVCCGNQCINGAQHRCCGPANDRYTCPSNYECCAGSRMCCDTTVARCCGGACVAYGNDNCGDCRQCNDGQVCCIGDQGQIYGCDLAVNCP